MHSYLDMEHFSTIVWTPIQSTKRLTTLRSSSACSAHTLSRLDIITQGHRQHSRQGDKRQSFARMIPSLLLLAGKVGSS